MLLLTGKEADASLTPLRPAMEGLMLVLYIPSSLSLQMVSCHWPYFVSVYVPLSHNSDLTVAMIIDE
jgi:hypothetical protein